MEFAFNRPGWPDDSYQQLGLVALERVRVIKYRANGAD